MDLAESTQRQRIRSLAAGAMNYDGMEGPKLKQIDLPWRKVICHKDISKAWYRIEEGTGTGTFYLGRDLFNAKFWNRRGVIALISVVGYSVRSESMWPARLR